jgi:iron(III) transport system ATP-binding protein
LSEPALRCRAVAKRFGSTVALESFDLEVEAGAIVALLGPSGCGKTTALRLVAGLEDPDAGTIEIQGRTVNGPGVFVPAERRGVGLVFQDYALFPHLSVGANVGYGLGGLSSGERAEKVRDTLTLVGLRGTEERLPSQLSGGQQQRVALARALAPNPQLILLDEPFSNLDASLRETVREEVRAILEKAETTAIFVTHDQEEALSLADQVAVMHHGHIHQVAAPQTLYNRPATRFVAEFVGDADVLPARRVGAYLVDTPLGRLSTADPVESEFSAVILRPEALTIRPTDDGPGTVHAVSFFGHDQMVTVELPDGTRIRARHGATLDVHRGDRVEVAVQGRVTVFEDASPDSVAVL